MSDKEKANTTMCSKTHSLTTEIIARVILWSMFIYLELQTPFIRVIQPEEMWMYKYPHVTQYVSPTALWFISIAIPMTFLSIEYARTRNNYEYSQGILCLTLLLGLNGFITAFLKITVGRPRPDFFWRCFPDGKHNVELNCTGDYKMIMEGRKSFPSGHASFSFASLVFLAMFLSRKLSVFDTHQGHSPRLLFSVLPILLASGIAISRTCDYHHHWQDVVFGALLGTTLAYICFRQYYPTVQSSKFQCATL